MQVSDEVAGALADAERLERNYIRRVYYHKAHYSLDVGDGIEACYLPEKKQREIAEAEGVSGNSVSKSIKRGLAVMRKYMNLSLFLKTTKTSGQLGPMLRREIHLAHKQNGIVPRL